MVLASGNKVGGVPAQREVVADVVIEEMCIDVGIDGLQDVNAHQAHVADVHEFPEVVHAFLKVKRIFAFRSNSQWITIGGGDVLVFEVLVLACVVINEGDASADTDPHHCVDLVSQIRGQEARPYLAFYFDQKLELRNLNGRHLLAIW